jgi:hypothetical protein
MNKIILLLLLLVSGTIFAQESEFKITNEGLTDYIVTKVEGRNQSQLYNKTKDWVSFEYKSPIDVIKAQMQDEYIRIEGSIPEYNVTYQIEVSFKDDRYKFDIIDIKRRVLDYNMTILIGQKNLLNKKGELKGGYNLYPKLINHFNELNQRLKTFCISDTIPTKNDDW